MRAYNRLVAIFRFSGWLALLAFCGLLSSQSKAVGRDPMKCVDSLDIPTSNVAARWAGADGTVEADVRIGPGGKIAKMSVRGPEEVLKVQVEAHLAQSRFRPQCAGRSVRFVFSFRFEGESSTTRISPPKVRFEPPNRFTITLQKAVPIIERDPGSTPPHRDN